MMRRAQPWLGTLVDIRIAGADAADARHAAAGFDAAFAVVAAVHRLMSFHDPASDVSRINRLAPGQSCSVHEQTVTVLRCAAMLEQVTGGIFNIACADVLAGWGYLPVLQPPADSVAVAGRVDGRIGALARNVLAIDATGHVTRQGAGAIDLGGIAKGYAVDTAVAALQAAGIGSGCVNAGGDLRAFGPEAFPVTVRDPRQPGAPGLVLAVQDQALATSACYFSRTVHEGAVRSALLNGGDGSATVHARSATVFAPTCMLADGLTKLVMATLDAGHTVLAQFSATALLL